EAGFAPSSSPCAVQLFTSEESSSTHREERRPLFEVGGAPLLFASCLSAALSVCVQDFSISIHKAASRILQRGGGQGGPLLLVPVRPDRRGGGLDQVGP